MLDTSHAVRASGGARDWRDRVHGAMTRGMHALAGAVSGRKDMHEVRFSLVKQKKRVLCLRVDCGRKSGFLKLFDGAGQDTQRAYESEKTGLLALGHSRLVPRIVAYSDPERWVLTRWIECQGGPDSLAGRRPEEFAGRVGEWLALYDAAAPSEQACGNWFSYLSACGDAVDLARVETAHEVLSAIPLCGRGLSRNDPALGNFMTRDNMTLVGTDFEKARMKPRGWDYILGFAALIERFPDQADEVVEAYADGFSKAHRGALITSELNDVARILFCARAIVGRQPEDLILWQ